MDAVETAPEYAHRAFVIRAVQLAACVAAVYDHALTLDREVKFIWQQRWGRLKALFLLIRYLALAMVLANALVFMLPAASARFCYIYTRFQALSAVLLVLLVQVIMQLRLFAIYGVQLALPASDTHTMAEHRYLPLLVAGCWLAQIAGLVSVLALAGAAHVRASTAAPAGLAGLCTPTHIPAYMPALWLPVLAFELLLVALAAKQGFAHIVQFARFGNWWCPKMLAGVLVRDSLLYFLATFGAYAATALLWWRLPPPWLELPEGACVAVTGVLGARLVLNLREAYHEAPSTALFSTHGGLPDIGWAPKTAGKPVSPMWPRQPVAQRMAKKARAAGAAPPAPLEIGDGRRAPAPRRRDRGVTSELAFAPQRRAAGTLDSDADECDLADPLCTRPGRGERDDVEGSPTTAVGSERRPWRGSTSMLGSTGSTASGGSVGGMLFGKKDDGGEARGIELVPQAWVSEETLGSQAGRR